MEILAQIASPIVTGVFTLVVCLLNNNAQMRKRDIEQDKQITEIKNELNKHIADVKTELREQIVELSAAYQQSTAIVTVKLDELDKKQEKHNQVIERVYKLEKTADVHDEKIKVANNRILDLEHSARK